MRPISARYQITQGFASLATAGVVGNSNGTMVQVLVAMYGNYQPDGHAGTDIGCPVGTPVYAARAGTVVLCDWDVNLPGDDSWSASGYFQRFAFYKRFGGRLLVVKVAPNDYDVYAHLSAWKVGYGQQITEGQLVAFSGDSSAGMDGQLGPHLHTERIVDLTYSTGNGLIFGRMDPTSVWGGIAAQAGTITQLSEEDEDMGILDEPIIREGGGPLNGKPTTLRAVVANFDANVHYTREAIKGTVGATVQAMFSTKINRQGGANGQTDLAATLAYLDANLDKLDAKQLLDPAAIESAVSEAADKALADITITLSSAPSAGTSEAK